MNGDPTQYATGAAGLFAAIAREEPQEDSKPDKVIVCSGCGSEDAQLLDNEFQLYKCQQCGKVFMR